MPPKKSSRSIIRPERSVADSSPGKSILKSSSAGEKPKEEQPRLRYNKIEPHGTYQSTVGEDQPAGKYDGPQNQDDQIAAQRQLEQLGVGNHVILQDRKFEEYLMGQKKLAFELGEQKRALRNIHFSLQERIAQSEPSHPKIWRLTEVRADIALNFAIQMMRLEKKDEAAEYLNIARKALEPLPGAEWGERFEWHKMRKELYENITIFYRQQQEWQKAFDNLRLTIGHQKRLGENTSETNLNCAIFLANMNRYAESIEYAQESCNEIEKFLGIVHNRPLQEYKYNGKNRDIMEEKDKQFTTYAMANHAVAKALMNLQYFKEARYFLNKASTAVNKCLNVPKRDLSIAVGNDMSRLTQVSRGTLKNMTEQQVKGSLITIKTDLATRAMSGYGGDRIEQRAVMRQVEDQIEEEKREQVTEAEEGVLNIEGGSGRADAPSHKQFNRSASQRPDDSELLVDQPPPNKQKQDTAPPEKAQRTSSRRSSVQEPKRVLYHDDSPKPNAKPANDKPPAPKPQQQRAKSEQPEPAQKSKRKKKDDDEEEDDLKFLNAKNYKQITNKLPPSQKEASTKSKKEIAKEEQDNKIDGKPAFLKGKRKKSMNVKTQRQNLAKEGSLKDDVGIKYSEDRGTLSYLRSRKQQIRELNKNLGYEESDQSMGSNEDKKFTTMKGSKSPPGVKLPAVSQQRTSTLSGGSIQRQAVAQAIAGGLSKEAAAVKDQSQRRQFIPKQQVSQSHQQQKASEEEKEGTLKFIQQIKNSMQIAEPEKERTPTPDTPSEYEEDLVDELQNKLKNQVNVKPQTAAPDKEIVDDVMDIFNQPNVEDSLLNPDRNKDLEKADKEELALPDNKSEEGKPKKPVQKESNQPDKKLPNSRSQGNLKNSDLEKNQKSSTANKKSSRAQVDANKKPVQEKQQMTPAEIERATKVHLTSKTDTGLTPKRKHGEPIAKLSTLKRQGTPPLEEELKAKKRDALIQRNSTSRQPTQQPKKSESTQPEKKERLKRDSLVYALMKEQKLNTGSAGRGGQIRSSRKPAAQPTDASADEASPSTDGKIKKKKKKVQEVSNNDGQVGEEDRQWVDMYRINRLSQPKKKYEPKKLTEQEFKQQLDKQAELQRKKSDYQKFDFAEYVDRDGSAIITDPGSNSKRPELNQAYRPLDGLQRKRHERQMREQQQDKGGRHNPNHQQKGAIRGDPSAQDTSPHGKSRSRFDDETFARAEEDSPLKGGDSTNNLAALVQRLSAVDDAPNVNRYSSHDESQQPLNIVTNDKPRGQNRAPVVQMTRSQASLSQKGGGESSPNNSGLSRAPVNRASDSEVSNFQRKKTRSGLPPRDSDSGPVERMQSDYLGRPQSIGSQGEPQLNRMPSNRQPVRRQETGKMLDNRTTQKNDQRDNSQLRDGLQGRNSSQGVTDKRGNVFHDRSNSPPPNQLQSSKQKDVGRKGKAPTQNSMTRRKSTMQASMKSYEKQRIGPYEYDPNEDSEVLADRAAKQQISSLRNLRQLENACAIKLQALIRQFHTRKWYLNLQVRRRLSVPYSGLDFAQNPFLRQFTRVNQRMQVGGTPLVEVISTQKADRRRNKITVVKSKPSQRQEPIPAKPVMAPQPGYGSGDPLQVHEPINNLDNDVLVEKPGPKRKIRQAASPGELLTKLKHEFIDHGLDAYEQFKKQGIGVDFDEKGQAYAQGGIQKVRKMIEEQRIAKLEFIGSQKPADQDELGDLDPQKLEDVETKQYQNIMDQRKDAKKDTTLAGQNVSSNIRHLLINMESKTTVHPIEQYQCFSREPIVFYKNMGFADQQVKWTIFAGEAFLDGQQMFLPVKIIGKPLRARSTIINYTMNLELLNIPREVTKKYDFETIWPYILYLFNNWVKHQVILMGIKRILPGMQDRLPDSNYTIFECHNDLREDFDALEDEAYKDMLNFSSELEIDPRFDAEPLHEPVAIEKSRPEGIRKTLNEVRSNKRKQIFEEYRNSVAKAIDMQEKQISMEMQKGRKFVQFAENLVDNLTVEEQLKLIGDDREQEKGFYLNQRDIDQFKQFLADHYVRLPKPQSNQIKLMSAMSQSIYWLMEKRNGLPSMQIAQMNEERRRIKQLPSLTKLDYNCIDRAAIKLRLILDCLQIERQISGKTIVPRNLKQQKRIQQFMSTVNDYIDFCTKKPSIAMSLLQVIGRLLIVSEPAMDNQTVALKFRDNQPPPVEFQESEIRKPYQQPKPRQQIKYEDEMDQEILGNQDSFKSSQIGIYRIPSKPLNKRQLQDDASPAALDYPLDELAQRVDQQLDYGSDIGGYGQPGLLELEEEHDQRAFRQKTFLEKFEIETVILDEQVLEQGIIRFNGLVYMASLVFKRITCNFDNMTILDQIREKRYKKQNKRFPLAKKPGENIDLEERDIRESRFQSKPCVFASSHLHVVEKDQEFLQTHRLEGNRLLDLQIYMNDLTQTRYSSYIEVKVCPRLSSTLWADSVLVTWEQLGQFFAFFGIQDWEPSNFLKRERFTQDEALIFYHFFTETLSLDEDDNVTLTFSLSRLNAVLHRYDRIFLDLQRYEWTQRLWDLNYFFPDALLKTGFDHCEFDELIFPFVQDPTAISKRLLDINADQNQLVVAYDRAPAKKPFWLLSHLQNRSESERLALNENFLEGQKTEILVEESTTAYLQDPASLFNLSLSKFPREETLFLGTLQLKPVKSDYQVPFTVTTAAKRFKAIQKTPTPSKFNVRIDYYVIGVVPVMSIRAFTQLASVGGSQGQVLNYVSHNHKFIKDVIRICKQTSQQMVYNQLQSIFSVESRIGGQRIVINHQITRQNRLNAAQQDIYSMLILNEAMLAKRLGPHNVHKYKGVMNLRSVSKSIHSVLASVSQYEIQQELLQQHGDLILELLHGNKHITRQMVQRTRELILQKTLEENPQTKLKEFKPLTVWRIQLLDMRKSSKHDAILTQDDLTYFFQSEIFNFFRENPHIHMPNILVLLGEYLQNLQSIRTPVGTTLIWNLPKYVPQIDENGIFREVPADQLYRVPKLDVYQAFERIKAEQNAFHDQNQLPMSLDQQKKTRLQGKIPSLCLKTRSCIERILPVYEVDDMRSLKYSSTEFQIITQVVRQFKAVSEFHFAIVTVTRHTAIEGWIWSIYFPLTQRTFTVTFFYSDLIELKDTFERLLTMDPDADPESEEAKFKYEVRLWTEIVKSTQLVQNASKDIVLMVEGFSESIKELLYQSYVYNEKSKDLYFMEVTVKSFSNYVTDIARAFPCIDLKDDTQSKDYTVSLRAYSMAKEQWIKDYQPLVEVIAMLKQDGIQWSSETVDPETGKLISKTQGVDPEQLMEVSNSTTNFYYSMIRNAAVLMSNKIKFADKPKVDKEVRKRKMTYDIQQILKAKKDELKQVPQRSDFQNIVLLNRIIYQATVSQDPIQVCSIAYNESKDIFVYRLYGPFTSQKSIERRFDGGEIQKTCCPHYQSMLANGMDKELGQRIAQFYHANILVASVLQINKLQGLVEAYPNLDAGQSVSKLY